MVAPECGPSNGRMTQERMNLITSQHDSNQT
jgi:hypothetical protein